MTTKDIGVPGAHNIENALAAIIVAKLNHVSNETIGETLKRFNGVPHRTQYIGKVQERTFYNDSKATNILATKMALSGFENETLILLAGGLDRGNSFDELIPAIHGLKGLVVFGETSDKLIEAGKKAGIKQITETENVESAVPAAMKMSAAGDTILLSPANASWDQYPNFEIRGTRFIDAVKRLNQ